MAPTRSQLLAGDQSQGFVLPGQVQGVKQGPGTFIDTDGTISFFGGDAEGTLRLNNEIGYNNYIWPTSIPVSNVFYLSVDTEGNLSWDIPDGLVFLGLAPSQPKLGKLWFDYSQNLLYVNQNKGGTTSWAPVYRGLAPIIASTSATPAFTGGNGTEAAPFTIAPVSVAAGRTILLPSVVQITGLAPFQAVPIRDLDADINGYRFSATDCFADSTGVLEFKVQFTDYPKSAASTAYTGKFEIGFEEPLYLSVSAGISIPLAIASVGQITGTPAVGQTLSYATGSASGGFPPYTYSWEWVRESDGLVLQTNGSTYVVGAALTGDRVFVRLTATDSESNSASEITAPFPAAPAVLERSDFPLTTILFPSTTTGTISTTWLDTGTTLEANGCIEFSVNAGAYSQGPTPINNSDTITTRWISSASCANAPNGTTIAGCIFDATYQECGSLTIDGVPSPFNFNPVLDIAPGSVATSQAVTPIGYNTRAYITFNGSSTGTSIQASTDNGSTWVTLGSIGSTTAPIDPGQTLRVRMTTGSQLSTTFSASINVGVNSSVQTTTFNATTSATSSFTTLIAFPSTTIEEIASPAWSAGDGSTSLTATGCIQFKVGSGGTWTGAGDPAVAITTGDILYTRWANVTPGLCGLAVQGTTITGTITNVPSSGSKTSSASLTIDRVPAAFTFTDLTGQAASSVATSNILNISGFNAPAYITKGTSTLTSFEAKVGAGAWTAIPTSGETLSINPVSSGPGTTLQIRGTTGATTGATYTGVVNLGQGASVYTDTWQVTNLSAVPSINTPTVTTPFTGTILNPNSYSPAGLTITTSTYTPLNGAGAHASTDWEVYYLSGTTPVYIVQSIDNTVNKTSYFIPASSFVVNRTYYIRVRYKTTSPSVIYSPWSPLRTFTTAPNFSITWVFRQFLAQSNLKNIYGAAISPSGTTVLVSASGSGNNYSYSTGEGVVYSLKGALPSNSSRVPVEFGNGKFVTTGAYSVDSGNSWVSVTTPINFASIAYSPTLDRFVAVGDTFRVFTSPGSSIFWSEVNIDGSGLPNLTATINSIIWDGTAFRGCGANAVISSPDGFNWTYQLLSMPVINNALFKMVYNSSLGVYLMTVVPFTRTVSFYGLQAQAGASSYFTSTNAVNWTLRAAPAQMALVATGGNRFVASSGAGTYENTAVLLSTTDITTWVWETEYITSDDFDSTPTLLHYIPGYNRFIACLGSNASLSRMFSTV